MLKGATQEALDAVGRVLERHRADLVLLEVGTVVHVSSGIARVRGLRGVGAEEIVRLPGDVVGIAASLEPHSVGVMLLGASEHLRAGDEVRRTGRVIDVPVGFDLLGRVVDGLGRPLDGGGPLQGAARWPVERPAPAILDRAPVRAPLQTGVKAVDALVPIGRGQRELILGDRQTGKTALAVDAIINQRGGSVISIYCAVGQRGSAVARVVEDLRAHGVMRSTIVVVAGGEAPPGLQFVAPYAATTMAEYFMERGRDVLIVYDDLTRHARAYRELSLLLRRPPGREAYPGDIFYVHSRLLERATHLRPERGGGSMTALPVIETQAQNIAAYIPTNLISITDGQIYLSPDLFQKGILPAIDVGRSVSRVGGRAQLPGYRAVAADLRLSHSQFEELEIFARFGTRLDEETRRRLERGRRIRETLKQGQHDLLSPAEQIVVLFAVTEGLFDRVPPDDVAESEGVVREAARARLGPLLERLDGGGELDEEDRQRIREVVRAALMPV
jgi:F-type H+-transporting ATPase subunit alpha